MIYLYFSSTSVALIRISYRYKIILINFSTEHKRLLSHLYLLKNKELLATPSEHDKLLISLRTAQANEYSLDKQDISYDDLLDAFRLPCRAYKIHTKE
jgi:hypothetical protein